MTAPAELEPAGVGVPSALFAPCIFSGSGQYTAASMLVNAPY